VVDGVPDFLRRQRVGRILIGADEVANDRAARGGDATALRSAFAISGPYVLTAWHCTGRDEKASLWFRLRAADGSYRYVPVRVVSYDKLLDAAVLEVDGTRLPDGELTGTTAQELLAQAAIPLAIKVIPEKVRVWGFSGSKPAYDGDSYPVTVVEQDLLPSGVRVMKLQGPEFSAGLPALVRGLSGGPVLRAIDPDADDSAGEVAVGFVRGSAGKDLASLGGEVITTRIADVAHLPEVSAALRADAVRTRRVPAYVKVIDDLIPPGGLPDRNVELAELAAFARPGSTRPPYAIWLGADGSGKTALAAYFARNPPPGVDVVAFFVSRNLGNQTEEFWEQACDQLAALLEEGKGKKSSADFVSLWAQAGSAAAAAGRTLVLLIDGLEANDPHPALLYRSIPENGDATRRVVIFSAPSAIGADRDFGFPAGTYSRRELTGSRQAGLAGRDIYDVLKTSVTAPMQDVLGVMAAAQSPLRPLDITEVLQDNGLLGTPATRTQILENRVRRELEAADQLGLVAPTLEDPESYAFQDDSVRRQVTEELRAQTVSDYQDLIKEWAAKYAGLDWPENTPRYLLAGYAAMLDRTCDSTRLLALTTMPARAERLRAVTGSDAAAVDELGLVLNHLARAEVPDLPLACRIALRREEKVRSMGWYPISLIRAKAMLGDWAAARHLASHQERPELRAQALVVIGHTAAAAGKAQLGHDLLVDALKAVSGITASAWRMDAIWTVARTALRAPWLIDPRTVSEAFTDVPSDPLAVYFALNAFAFCASSAGRMADALAFLGEAYRIADAAKPPEAEPRRDDGDTLRWAAGAPADRAAQELYGQAIMVISEPAAMVARQAAASGDTDTAVKVAALIPGLVERIGVLSLVHRVSATAGGRVGPVLEALSELSQAAAASTVRVEQVQALTALAEAFAACGLPADGLLNDAQAAVGHIIRPGPRAAALTAVARAAIGCGLPARRLLAQARAAAANGLTDQAERTTALAAVGWATAAAGQPDDARVTLAADLADPGSRAGVFAFAATAAPLGGQPASGLLAAARTAAASLNGFATQALACNVIAQSARAAADTAVAVAAAAEADNTGRRSATRSLIIATAAGTSMSDPALRAQALATMAQSITASGGPGDRVFAAAHAAAGGIIDAGRRGWALTTVAQAAVLARRYAAAAEAAADIPDAAPKADTLTTIAVAASAAQPVRDLTADDPRADDPSAEDPSAEDPRAHDPSADDPRASLSGAGEPGPEDPGHGDLLINDLLVNDLLGRARQVAASITSRPQRGAALGAVGQGALDARRYAAAEQTVAEMADPVQRASALATIALAVGESPDEPTAGDVSAAGLIAQASAIIADVEEPAQESWVLGMIAQAAAAGGDTSLARKLVRDADGKAMSADPVVRAIVLGVLARAASTRPGRAEALFGEACRATDVAGDLRRSLAVTNLAFVAAGQAGWPAFLAGQVRRAAGLADSFERAQLLAALAQAANDAGDTRQAADIAAGIPDAGTRIWALTGLARSAAARREPALAGSFLSQACHAAGIPGHPTVDWAPLSIAQAAAAAGRVDLARAAAQAIAWEQYRTTALAVIDSVATMHGPEPEYFSPAVFDIAWMGVTAEAACAAGWFTVAGQLAASVTDLNYRAQLLLTVADAAARAGDSGRASAAARAVLGMKGNIDRLMLGRALAIVVGGLADRDQDGARRELVGGLADCFFPDLLGLAAQLAPETIDVLADELNVVLPSGGD
jgi:hypothetical protein